MAARQGSGTVVIRRSHHIASLASFHQRATDQGLLMLLACSDPQSCSVAPFGGLDAVFTPNPLSAGIPAPGLLHPSEGVPVRDYARRVRVD